MCHATARPAQQDVGLMVYSIPPAPMPVCRGRPRAITRPNTAPTSRVSASIATAPRQCPSRQPGSGHPVTAGEFTPTSKIWRQSPTCSEQPACAVHGTSRRVDINTDELRQPAFVAILSDRSNPTVWNVDLHYLPCCRTLVGEARGRCCIWMLLESTSWSLPRLECLEHDFRCECVSSQ